MLLPAAIIRKITGRSFALVLQIPFNFLYSVTLDTQHSTAGQNIQRVTYSHAIPSDSGFS
ncbi:MAG: hypothetical protein AB8W37_12115 [Arsenophonus endosymbiont of Dermacentor nuttalli]